METYNNNPVADDEKEKPGNGGWKMQDSYSDYRHNIQGACSLDWKWRENMEDVQGFSKSSLKIDGNSVLFHPHYRLTRNYK